MIDPGIRDKRYGLARQKMGEIKVSTKRGR
jgi:hypothetical protein